MQEFEWEAPEMEILGEGSWEQEADVAFWQHSGEWKLERSLALEADSDSVFSPFFTNFYFLPFRFSMIKAHIAANDHGVCLYPLPSALVYSISLFNPSDFFFQLFL